MFRLYSVLIGYLLGCIQTAFIVGKIKGKIDIREHGSGNSGTTNAIRVLGWKYGAITFFADLLKGVAAVLISWIVFDNSLAGFYAGIGTIIGHNWPVFLKFKGGKGIASTIGVMLAVDYRIGLIMIVVLAITIIISKYVSLGSVLMVLSILIMTLIFHNDSIEYMGLSLFITVSALFKHRSNIKRLVNGTETKLGHKKNIVEA